MRVGRLLLFRIMGSEEEEEKEGEDEDEDSVRTHVCYALKVGKAGEELSEIIPLL